MNKIDLLFILCLFLLYFLPRTLRKYKYYWVMPLLIFFLSIGIRIHSKIENRNSSRKIGKLNTQIVTLENELDKTKKFVNSSTIQVYLKFKTGQKSNREFNGVIGVIQDEVFLDTKSGKQIKYISDIGTTRKAEHENIFEFFFKAKLPMENNPHRENPEEFQEAKTITIPLSCFIENIKERFPTEFTCTLIKADIIFYINNKEVTSITKDLNTKVDKNKNDILYMDF